MGAGATYRLRQKLFGDSTTPIRIIELYQMLGEVDERLRQALELDVIGIPAPNTMFGFPLRGAKAFKMHDGTPVLVPEKFNWTVDQNGRVLAYPQGDTSVPPCAAMPTGSYFFDAINCQGPIDEDNLNPADNCQEFGLLSENDLQYYRDAVHGAYETTQYGIYATLGGMGFGDVALVPGPFLKDPKGIRDVEEWYVSLAIRPNYVRAIFEKQCEYALKNIEMLAPILNNRVQVVFVSGADFGSQRGLLCSANTYRELFKPFHKAVNDKIHSLTSCKTFIHTCGGIRELIPDFIEAGFDILNPVQCSADGMDAHELKKEFGKQIVFWGGGVDTQKTLPFGTPEEIYRQVRERIEIFNDGGGFVFSSIHNVQSDVPVENMMAMFKAIKDSR